MAVPLSVSLSWSSVKKDFWIFVCFLPATLCSLYHVEIVSLGVRRGGSFLSFFNSGPGIDMGVEDLKTLYNNTFNVTHTYLYEKDAENCYELAIQSDVILSEWYYIRRTKADLYVFIAASKVPAIEKINGKLTFNKNYQSVNNKRKTSNSDFLIFLKK
jgi:hypothetical protein